VAQPQCIAGVTDLSNPGRLAFPGVTPDNGGPISIPNQTILKILEGRTDSPDYLHFIGLGLLVGSNTPLDYSCP
jgi:hypothetical protein